MKILETISPIEPKALEKGKLIKHLLEQPQVSTNVTHSFGPGVYIRTVQVPKDTFAVGHYHKYAHTNVFLKGKVFVFKDDGSTEVLTAPMIFTGPPGRKIGHVLEDMVWLNIYPTDERDISVLEDTLFDETKEWDEHVKGITPDTARIELDRKDYLSVLEEINWTQEQVDREVFDQAVLIKMPEGTWSFQLAPSPIHGKGVFASSDIPAGTVIGPALFDYMKTPLGRYTNHGYEPNAAMHKCSNGDVVLMSIKDIKGYTGGMVGDEITVNYRDVLKLHRKGM